MAEQLNAPFGRLVIESGEHQGMIFPLRDSVISIGRGPDNTIQVIDTRMSRNHTAIILNEGNWLARDLRSKNGTSVNDATIQGDTPLAHGDRVQVGNTIFSFELERPAAGQKPSSAGLQVVEDGGSVSPRQTVDVGKLAGTEPHMALASGSLEKDDADRLSVLYRVTEMAGSILDLDSLLEKVMDLVQDCLQPDRAGVLLYDERHNLLVPRVIRRPAHASEDIVISNTIIRQAVNDRLAVLVADAPSDHRYSTSESIAIQRIRSAICAPLIDKGDVLGVLYIDRRRPISNFSEIDLMMVAAIANQAALAISNARLHRRLLARHAQERELEIARSIQQRLLPEETPDLPGYELCAMSEPARQVGGDYYDFIPLPDGRIVLAIADVSGKGVPAAILLASVRAAVQVEARALVRENLSDVVSRLNQMVCRDTGSAMFVTMVLAVLDPAARRVMYCNAGHMYPMLRRTDGSIETFETGGCLLGVLPGTLYQTAEVALMPGEVLLFFTDGVTDVMREDGEMYGMERLRAFVHGIGDRSHQEIMAGLLEETGKYAGDAEAFDDFTMMVLKVLKS